MNDRFAVIDIGSNSIRLVVYGAPLRAPTILFNEKLMVGLGVGVQRFGVLEPKPMKVALKALARFVQLAEMMGVRQPRTVATAAVRQAQNGAAFLAEIRQICPDVELLSGEQEAEAAGLGVIAGIEQADGIVGDLGGGSLELARVKGGVVHQRASFPLGVLRIAAIREKGKNALERTLSKQMAEQGWATPQAGLPFYLVGGSWRSLAKIHMHLTRYPLSIVHNYTMPPEAATRLVRAVSRIDRGFLKSENIVTGSRIPAMDDAAAMLSALVHRLSPTALIASATGLREGLLFQSLTDAERAADPLIIAARAEGARQGRFPEHGDMLDAWISRLFSDETIAQRRLRHAACLLGDIGWAANPDFRAERGLEAALHGNWTGLNAAGRAMIGQALFTAFGGGAQQPAILSLLASPAELDRAQCWGLAMRLGQRLSGGTAKPLIASRIARSETKIILTLDGSISALQGEAVDRRLRQLAGAMASDWECRVGDLS
jgi:exopolyphosphatase / guanosine-5'-triphosphate,3'-diphosphate pyrophosphatase